VVKSRRFEPTATCVLEECPALEPLVSVIIAAYNSGAWLTETVESALAQTWPRREIIVVDEGSTSDLRPLLEPYKSAVSYQQNRAYARASLLKLRRLAPRESRAALYLAALALPPAVATALAQCWRQARGLWRVAE
jgi:cellulose synthase/poly-beta-1,6-N-acetylglucosamine synthase-like glycosyltransferase